MAGIMAGEERGPRGLAARIEDGFSVAILSAMVVIPVFAVVTRWITGAALPGANLYVQSFNLWIAFTGGMLAARAGKHLSLSTGALLDLKGLKRDLVDGFTSAIATAVTAWLAYASVQVVVAEMDSTQVLPGGIPNWVFQTMMPVGFAVIALRLAWGNRTWAARLTTIAVVLGTGLLALVPEGERVWIAWSGSAVVLLAVALGAPIYTAMGGIAMLLFFSQPLPVPLSAVPAETYRIVASASLPALPLFTLAGYLLAEGGASRRLIRLFEAWFGWLPGGMAAAAVLVCAFFTTFTGASGVTILALGGLLLPVLTSAGYERRFAVGLLVASGSIGLLFPPSLPVILYGVVSHVPISDLFISGAVPGVVLVVLLIGMAVVHGVRLGLERRTFELEDALQALWEAKWEALLPVLVLVGIFGGFLTIFEAAAFTAAYALLTEVVIHRDLHPLRDLPGVFVECATLIGGVLIILGVALGFTSFLVDAEVPYLITKWVEAHVGNKFVFILLLNLFLLIVGCLMDIYSAIAVVVPLIVPIAVVFDIHPVHLGILFLANLELGYLTPPVGMNLFLASYRFKMPLATVYRLTLPFLGVLLLGVFFIAYVPAITTWPHGDADENRPPSIDDLLDEDPELDMDAIMRDLNGEGATDEKPAPIPELDLEEMMRRLNEPTEAEPEEPASEGGAERLSPPDP